MIIISVAVEELLNNMILAENICTASGEILEKEGNKVTDEMKRSLQSFDIKRVLVYMEGEVSEQALDAYNKRNGIIVTERELSENLKEIFVNTGNSQKKELFDTLNHVLKQEEESEKLISLLNQINQNERELYQHLVGVGVLAQQLAIWSGCNDEEIKSVALAGLLHDIGLYHGESKQKGKILFKNELDMHGYEKHVTDGNYMLKNLKVSPSVIRGVLAHHERIDGRGYPLKILGPQINRISRIVAVADTYDTYTMKYKDENGFSVLEALQKLEDDGSRKLDPNLVQLLIDNVVETVIGRRACLSDGTIGKIVMINKYALLYPTVECKGKNIDLSRSRRVWIEELL